MSPIRSSLRTISCAALLAFFLAHSSTAQSTVADSSPKPKKNLSVLLVTGGCCHDYDFQSKAMQLAAQEKGIPIDWTIVNQGGKGTTYGHSKDTFSDKAFLETVINGIVWAGGR